MDNSMMELVYYDAKNPAGYGGVRHLARATRQPIEKARKFLSSQRAYTIHRNARKRMPQYRTYFAPFFGYNLQADLNEMPTDGNMRYLLTCIDVFSRYAWAIPLKSKHGIEIKNAFKDYIISDIGEDVVRRLQTDKGTEFHNSIFKNYLDSIGVNLYSVTSSVKAALAERFNRTLKQKLFRYFTHHNTRKWVNVVGDFVKGYNNSIHSTHGFTPYKARHDKYLWQQIWLGYQDESRGKKYVKPKLKLGDAVRLSKVKATFAKGYDHNFTEQIFYIHKVDKRSIPVMYTVKDYNSEIIDGKFYAQELQKVQVPDKWPIEKIIRRRENKHLVKFLGYPEHYWVDLV